MEFHISLVFFQYCLNAFFGIGGELDGPAAPSQLLVFALDSKFFLKEWIFGEKLLHDAFEFDVLG